MIRYALTRLTLLVVGLFVASALIFFTLRVLPGDVAQLIGGTQASPAQVEAIRLKLGLNEPLFLTRKESASRSLFICKCWIFSASIVSHIIDFFNNNIR